MHLIRRAAFRAAAAAPAASARSLSTRTAISPFRIAAQQPSRLAALALSTRHARFYSDEVKAEAAAEAEAEAEGVEASEPAGDFQSTPWSRSPSESGSSAREVRAPLQLTPTNSIYVGNLQFEIVEEDLKREFAEFGPIKSVRLATDNRGLSKGFGYVEFDTVETATAAITARNQTLLEGRRLVVNYQGKSSSRRDSPKNPPSKTLFIGNLAFEMSDADLNKLFRDIRNVIDVRVAIDRRTGQPRGFAHADFTDVESAQKALAFLSEKEVYGRALRVDFSASKLPRLGDGRGATHGRERDETSY